MLLLLLNTMYTKIRVYPNYVNRVKVLNYFLRSLITETPRRVTFLYFFFFYIMWPPLILLYYVRQTPYTLCSPYFKRVTVRLTITIHSQLRVTLLCRSQQTQESVIWLSIMNIMNSIFSWYVSLSIFNKGLYWTYSSDLNFIYRMCGLFFFFYIRFDRN